MGSMIKLRWSIFASPLSITKSPVIVIFVSDLYPEHWSNFILNYYSSVCTLWSYTIITHGKSKVSEAPFVKLIQFDASHGILESKNCLAPPSARGLRRSGVHPKTPGSTSKRSHYGDQASHEPPLTSNALIYFHCYSFWALCLDIDAPSLTHDLVTPWPS